jgi:hypothetical protein
LRERVGERGLEAEAVIGGPNDRRGPAEAGLQSAGDVGALGGIKDAVAAAEHGLGRHLVTEADARRDIRPIAVPESVRRSADTREGETATEMEAGHRNFGDGMSGIGGHRLRGEGQRCVEVEVADRAVEALGNRRVVFPAHADIERQPAGDAPVVLHEGRVVLRLVGHAGVHAHLPAGWNAEQHGCQPLAHSRAGGGVGRLGVGAAEAEGRRDIAVGERIVAVEPVFGSNVQRMVAVHAREGGDQVVRIVGIRAAAAAAGRSELIDADRGKGYPGVVRGALDRIDEVLRKAERCQVEPAAERGGIRPLVQEAVTDVQQHRGIERVHVVESEAVAHRIVVTGEGDAGEILRGLGEHAVAEPEEGTPLLAEVVVEPAGDGAVLPDLVFGMDVVVDSGGIARSVQQRVILKDRLR